MKGKVLDFSIADSCGVISGDDGIRYTFIGKEWKSYKPPQAGMLVDFDYDGKTATGVYIDKPATTSCTPSWVDNSPYDGFYRSSDYKVFGGVCAGLAHKWNVSRFGLRLVTYLWILFFWWPLLIYCLYWIIFKPISTKKAL